MSEGGRNTPAFLPPLEFPAPGRGSHLSEAAMSYINTGQVWKDVINEQNEIISSFDWTDRFVDGLQKKCSSMLKEDNLKELG